MGILYKDEVGTVEEGKDQGVDGLTWATISNGETKTSVVGLYFIPSNSSRKRVEHNEKLAAAFEKLMTRLTGERVCVLGDANARFGELDSVAFRSFDAADDEDEVMAEVVYERQSVDKKVNKEGKEFMALMNTANVVVLNGVKCQPMEHTQVGALGWSVLDIVGVTPQLIGNEWGVRVVQDSDVEWALITGWWSRQQ